MTEEQPKKKRRKPKRIGKPGEAFEPTGAFKARIAKLAEAFPGPADGHPVPATDDLADWRRDTYATAWANSLRASDSDDLAHWTLDQLAAEQQPDALRAFAEQCTDKGALRTLVLGGPVGTGKTSAAVAIGNALLEQGRMVRFVRHSTYLKWLRPEGAPTGVEDWQIRRRFRECDVLVLDDLAASLDGDVKAREFVRTETLDLIGDRADSPGKVTIITTNQKAEVRGDDGRLVGGLTMIFGEQVMSRLSKNGYALTITGPDRRGRLTW